MEMYVVCIYHTMFRSRRLRSLDTQRGQIAVGPPAIYDWSSINTSSHGSIRLTKSDLKPISDNRKPSYRSSVLGQDLEKIEQENGKKEEKEEEEGKGYAQIHSL